MILYVLIRVPSVKAVSPNDWRCSGAEVHLKAVSRVILGLLVFPVETAQGTVADYALCAGDRIRVDVLLEPDLTIEQRLDRVGEVTIPLLGIVQLVGKTVPEAQRFLEQAFTDGGYLVEPQVSVTILQHASRVFYVFGEVNSPGAKELPPGVEAIGILEALTLGGELSRYARRSGISIQPQGLGAETEGIKVDLDALLKGLADPADERYRVRAGDIVFVPERVF